MQDESSQSKPFPKNNELGTESRGPVLTLRFVIIHSLLLASAPFVQSFTTITGGWIDSTPLLSVFIVGPVLGMILYRSRQERLGSILLLAFMPAAAYSHGRILLSLFIGPSIPIQTTMSVVGFEILLALLVTTSLVGSLLSFSLLRGSHAADPHGERNTTL